MIDKAKAPVDRNRRCSFEAAFPRHGELAEASQRSDCTLPHIARALWSAPSSADGRDHAAEKVEDDLADVSRRIRSGRGVAGGEMTPEETVAGQQPDRSLDVPAWVQDSALLDAIAAAVVATDTAGTIFYFNAAAEQLYGYSREAMLGANVMQLLVEPVDEVPAAVIMETVRAGERWSGLFRVRRHGGSSVVVRVTDTPITEQGRVVGVIGVAEQASDDLFDGSLTVTPHIESAALRLADQMRQAMETRAVIEQAKGMLIAAHGCTPDQAFQMLSESSQRTNRKLRDLAKAMVDGAQSR